MENVVRAFAIQLLSEMTTWAMDQNHVVGENNDYYVTLEELTAVLKKLLDKYDR